MRPPTGENGMGKPRLVVALLLAASALSAPHDAVAGDEGACTWVGDTEVCVPPR